MIGVHSERGCASTAHIPAIRSNPVAAIINSPGTGKQVWESDKVTYLKDGASIHLTPNGDSVLLYTDRGELIRAQLTSAGYKEISRVAVLEPTFPFAGRNVAWSPPAYANRHIFARNSKELICASLAKP